MERCKGTQYKMLAFGVILAAACYVFPWSSISMGKLSSVWPSPNPVGNMYSPPPPISDPTLYLPERQKPHHQAFLEHVDHAKKKQLELFESRRNHVRQECQVRRHVYNSTKSEIVQHLLLSEERHFIFCFIQKNSCSFWKRVFKIIDSNNKNFTVFDLSGVAIHGGRGFATLRERRFQSSRDSLIQASKKVMFVRDPYHRLFSGYIDKIFNPCMLKGVQNSIIKHFRRPPEQAQCQRGVNFTEFLLYVTNKENVEVNIHFRRQYTACGPCQMDYDFYGKLETFHRDADFTLRHVAHVDPSLVFGQEETFEENSDVNIMHDAILFRWNCGFNRCVTPYRKMLILWTLFQVRGFLSVQEKFPLSKEAASHTTVPQFESLVLAAYRRPVDRAAVKHQRQQALQEAFRSVPPDVMAQVEQYVRNDCRLFDYDCDPTTRFPPISPPSRTLFRMEEVLLVD